jgi:hypothetical protein
LKGTCIGIIIIVIRNDLQHFHDGFNFKLLRQAGYHCTQYARISSDIRKHCPIFRYCTWIPVSFCGSIQLFPSRRRTKPESGILPNTVSPYSGWKQYLICPGRARTLSFPVKQTRGKERVTNGLNPSTCHLKIVKRLAMLIAAQGILYLLRKCAVFIRCLRQLV